MRLQTRDMAEDEVCIDEECNRCDAIAKEVGFIGWTQSMVDSAVYWCPSCSAHNRGKEGGDEAASV